ncbi:MAG: alpha/beta hydrolase, partial [Phycisphaerales bacterium]
LVLVSPVPPRTGWQRRRHQLLDARHTPGQRAELQRINATIAHTRDPGVRERLYLEHFNTALPSYVAPEHRAAAPRIEWYSRKINAETMADVHRTYADRSWEAGLRGFRAPTLIVHGREDIIPWKAVAALEALLPHTTLVGLDNCGHFPWLEVPGPFRSVMEQFLLVSGGKDTAAEPDEVGGGGQ